MWKSFGLHLEVIETTSGTDFPFLYLYDAVEFSKASPTNRKNRRRVIRSIRDSIPYPTLASVEAEIYQNRMCLAFSCLGGNRGTPVYYSS